MNLNPSFNPQYQQNTTYPTATVPGPPPTAPLAQLSVNENATREYLTSCKWPAGLQQTFINNLQKIPIRFFICDDSGSMNTDDGHRLITSATGHQKFVACSRWAELTAALSFHATIAQAANAPTQFRLLNAASPINIGDGSDSDGSRYRLFMTLLQQSPSGSTPLCAHIRDVITQITAMAPDLRSRGQKACVIIATDGESSDGDVAQALKPLEHLPAWVVIRLCTDEEKIVNYWNNIDNDLELDMDVLDDLEGEAKEIEEVNRWLTYGEPLHRLREFGIPIKEIDLLDEKALTLDQIRLFASLLFGGDVSNYPHPAEEWKEFRAMLTSQAHKVGKTFNPIDKRLHHWIRVRLLPHRGSCIIL